MEKITKISEFKKGENITIRGDIVVSEKIASNGNKYKSLKVEDTSNIAYANIFDNDKNFSLITKEKFYGEIECVVESVKEATNKYNTFNILSIKECERNDVDNIVNIPELKEYLAKAIHDMKHPGYRQLLFNLFKREDIKGKFFEAPGSEKAGYSFRGGLLARVVRLIKLSKAIKNVYDDINFNLDDTNTKLNEDLLITASIFTEIGRINQLEFTSDKRIEKTDVGNLFDTEHISSKILFEELQKVGGLLDEEEKLLLEHISASTLGQVPSATPEAFAYSLLSLLDKKLSNLEYLKRTSGKVDFAELFGRVMCLKQVEEI